MLVMTVFGIGKLCGECNEHLSATIWLLGYLTLVPGNNIPLKNEILNSLKESYLYIVEFWNVKINVI